MELPNHKDGPIYVVDVRNGLYILRYSSPGAESVERVNFYEGNSNRGQRSPAAPADRPTP